MFFPNSRYANQPAYTEILPDGRKVTVVRLPLPLQQGIRGFHRRIDGQRLDHIASHYLTDATLFWRLCDENGALVPDALAARDLIGVPSRGR